MSDLIKDPSRRSLLTAGAGAAIAGILAPRTAAAAPAQSAAMQNLDPIRTEHVLDLVVTCSNPEPMGPNPASKDGERGEIWPIIGGRFRGRGIQGSVVPGGGDYPVVRPDGVVVIDALYRLKTDDGVTIIIHNKGLYYPAAGGGPERYRLVPDFTAPVGKYDWLNKSIFLSTLVFPVPPALALAKGPNENDRLLQIHRVL